MDIDARKIELIQEIIKLKSEKVISALEDFFATSDKIYLSSEQIEMLKMSEKDVEYGRVVSEEELDKIDSEWLG